MLTSSFLHFYLPSSYFKNGQFPAHPSCCSLLLYQLLYLFENGQSFRLTFLVDFFISSFFIYLLPTSRTVSHSGSPFKNGQSFRLTLLAFAINIILALFVVLIPFKQAPSFIPYHLACFSPLDQLQSLIFHQDTICYTLSHNPATVPASFPSPSLFFVHLSLLTLPPRSSQILTDLLQIFYRFCSLHPSLLFVHFSLIPSLPDPHRSSQIFDRSSTDSTPCIPQTPTVIQLFASSLLLPLIPHRFFSQILHHPFLVILIPGSPRPYPCSLALPWGLGVSEPGSKREVAQWAKKNLGNWSWVKCCPMGI